MTGLRRFDPREEQTVAGTHGETSFLVIPSVADDTWSEWISPLVAELGGPVAGQERSHTPQLAVYDPAYATALRERLELSDHLRQARSRDELFLVYQPLVDAIDGVVVGAEVLMRWKSPQFGMVSPATFIPLAEDLGVIGELTEWMLARAWYENTEGLLLRDSVVGRGVLDQLVEMGFSLSIDDFGTGYSNLSYLRSLNVHRVKIDRSFVMDLFRDDGTENPRAAPLVEAMVFMARTLGIQTLAEGVESQVEADLLRELGCETFQGYFFAKPQPLGTPRAHLRGSAPAG